ncbi:MULTISPECIES: class I SAM-dependent methyltransferase [unclassified Pseudomonas]|uniref:class I SAM-dependent methyltransferase n=1 Tax=unclassified Pseudomonas TaxID=196821 RepID=UPI003204E3BF
MVLDIGCGPASLLPQVARLNPRAEFIGTDLSHNRQNVARESNHQYLHRLAVDPPADK